MKRLIGVVVLLFACGSAFATGDSLLEARSDDAEVAKLTVIQKSDSEENVWNCLHRATNSPTPRVKDVISLHHFVNKNSNSRNAKLIEWMLNQSKSASNTISDLE